MNSLNNYSSLSDKKQKQISAVLSNDASTSQTLSAVSIEEKTKSDSYLAGAASRSLFQNCQIGTVNVQVSARSYRKVFKDSFRKKAKNHRF